ncbi:DDE-type integrase/transposase/recombinase [Microlunatus speluncae]|uniref:DDE-type integrase/transposase/recombinase n=1 Tax=Microlunatus speluncae TaxID=2594267 RepID=UPI001C2CE3AE|nr:DDE-type integrase/transposase/recombinase [Microlunatus speluncae]
MKLLDAALIAALTSDADVFGGDFQRWCKINKIPRATAYRHKKRIEVEGRWTARSRRPDSCPHQTPAEVEAEVVRLRRADPTAGAEMIGYELGRVAAELDWAARGWRVPSRATINTILTRNELIEPQPQKRPKSSFRRFVYARPRDCYQIDATIVHLAGDREATVFEVLDDCSRLLVASHVTDAETAAGAVVAIGRAFSDYGVPGLVLSDNGSAFTQRHRRGGISRFTRTVTEAGARLIHSSPYHPQTCGKVERHHRTFKDWLADQPLPATQAELQALCDRYQLYYNTQRRHSAWNQPPWQTWLDLCDHGGPGRLPVQQDADVRVLKISENGRITIGITKISIGRGRAGEIVTALIDGTHATIYAATGQPLGHQHLTHHGQVKIIPAAA